MISRRGWLSLAARAGVGAVVAPWIARDELLSQAADGFAVSDQLIRRALRPPDFETPVRLLDSFITPNESFYVRSHLPVPPALDDARWRLTIDGNVATPLSLSLNDLRALPPAAVTMTLECAGNGRAFFDPPVAGVQWEKGAVGTARWTGVRLADLLARAGVRSSVRNVLLTPADRPLGTMPAFVRQLPLAKAMHRDTLVAYEMNGVPIPALHGFPLRVIVPGWEGAYSVKWLTALSAIDADTDSFWVATAYRYPNRAVRPGETVDAKDMLPLSGLAVKSLITRPADGAVVAPGRTVIAGFAWAGEAEVTRVEVSTDGGATWQMAGLGEPTRYAWRRFEHALTATRPGSYVVLSRASDSQGRVQPGTAAWNPSGYLWNQYDTIGFRVSNSVPAPMPRNGADAAPAAAASSTPPDAYSACTACHGADLIDQQRLTRAGWEREVEKMMRWGARVPESEKQALIDYLMSRTSRR